MSDERKGRWMLTASGRAYWPSDPRSEDVCIEDIASHLSKLCRFTGACNRFYSVAEHSVHVSNSVPLGYALAGLMHDATEAYVADLNKPTKMDPRMTGYEELEFENWQVIAERFELALDMPARVKEADQTVYLAERAVLMPPIPPGCRDMYEGMVAAKVKILALPPHRAERLFMRRFRELTE